MKDYHDLWMMAHSKPSIFTDMDILSTTIRNTFLSRGTKAGLIPFDKNLDYTKQQQYWRAHLRGLSSSALAKELPQDFSQVVAQINKWLSQHVTHIAHDNTPQQTRHPVEIKRTLSR